MKNEKWKKIIAGMLLMVIVLLEVLVVFPAEAEAVEYKQIDVWYKQRITIKTTSNYYFNKENLTQNAWCAYCIEEGENIGVIEFGVRASQTTSSAKTYFGDVNYGQTWGDAVDIRIVMRPQSSIKAYQYVSEYSNMLNASKYPNGKTKTCYVGSEDLVNYVYLPSPSKQYGFLSNWSPQLVEEIDGYDTYTIGLSVGSDGVSVNTNNEVTISSPYVKIHDQCNNETMSKFNIRYDYKKYVAGATGRVCTAGRRAVIFGTSAVDNSFEYRAVKGDLNLSRSMYVTGKFTVCDSKSCPVEIKTYQGTKSIKIDCF